MGARVSHTVVAATAAIGVTAAMVVAAMAARSPLTRSTPVNAASARVPILAVVFVALGVAIVAVAALAALAWPSRRHDDDEPELAPARPPVHWVWKALATLLPIALGVAFVLAAALGTTAVHRPPGVLATGGIPGLPTARAAPAGSSSGFVVPSWLPWTALSIVVALLVAAALSRIARRRRPAIEGRSERGVTRAAVQSAIDAVDTDADPRLAILAAYAAMEHAFAVHGLARRPPEAPREYLRRVLITGTASADDAAVLTGLFEEARFSTHALPERSRERASSALRSLRARLSEAI